jgi:hypothetical protein
MLTAEQRSLRASIAANTRWSRENPGPTIARANAGRLAKYEREVRADAEANGEHLTDDELARRVRNAITADMRRLALKSSKARARRAD